MLRGGNVFKELIINEQKKELQKGRSKDLISRRNVFLIHRFYYHVVIQRRTFEDAVTQLQDEFFLSENTIGRLVVEHATDIKAIKKENPTIKKLNDEFPFYKWEQKK